jgi:hypothetical protein
LPRRMGFVLARVASRSAPTRISSARSGMPGKPAAPASQGGPRLPAGRSWPMRRLGSGVLGRKWRSLASENRAGSKWFALPQPGHRCPLVRHAKRGIDANAALLGKIAVGSRQIPRIDARFRWIGHAVVPASFVMGWPARVLVRGGAGNIRFIYLFDVWDYPWEISGRPSARPWRLRLRRMIAG